MSPTPKNVWKTRVNFKGHPERSCNVIYGCPCRADARAPFHADVFEVDRSWVTRMRNLTVTPGREHGALTAWKQFVRTKPLTRRNCFCSVQSTICYPHDLDLSTGNQHSHSECRLVEHTACQPANCPFIPHFLRVRLHRLHSTWTNNYSILRPICTLRLQLLVISRY